MAEGPKVPDDIIRHESVNPANATADTGFSETLDENSTVNVENLEFAESCEQTLQKTTETRSRVMTEKGLEFNSAVKEKAARAANKAFHDNLNAFHTFLVKARDCDQIGHEMKQFLTLAEGADEKLRNWFELVRDAPQAAMILDLLETIKSSVEGARGSASEKLRQLQIDETTSIKSHASRKSTKSKRSHKSSISSSSSSKETWISVKAKRAVLEQKIKYSDAIEEQQRVLNKLKLHRELSETIAEEAVYKGALQEEFPFEEGLPREKEDMINRYMKQTHIEPSTLTPANTCFSSMFPDNTGNPTASQPPTLRGHTDNSVTLQPSAFPVTSSPPTAPQSPAFPTTGSPTAPLYTFPDNIDNPTASQTIALGTDTDNIVVPQPSAFPVTGSPTAPPLHTFCNTTSNPNTSRSFVFHNTGDPTTPRPFMSPETSTPVTSQLTGPLNTNITFVTSQPIMDNRSSVLPTVPQPCTLRPEASVFTPISPLNAAINRAPPTDNVRQIAEALAKVTQLQRLPQTIPQVFRGEEMDTKFFIWETAFDALVDSAPISGQQKLYLLYQHLDGKAKKVVEQLQYMVGANPDIAYREARKKLKQRFGRSAIVAADFENKLANWPKIAGSDAKGIREFSDFLQQVELASAHLQSLKIFEYPSKLQTLVEKLPSWFLTKWTTKVQILQQKEGYDVFPSFSDFVKEVTFHAERMNIPQISCLSNSSRSSAAAPSSTTAPSRRRTPGSTTLASRTDNKNNSAPLSEPRGKNTASNQPTDNSFKVAKLCLFHKTKTHTLNECQKFRELSLEERKEFFKRNKLCFKCAVSDKHIAQNCDQSQPDCDICHNKHVTALHKETKTETADSSSVCTQVCGREESGRSCARIVLVKLVHQSQPSNEIVTYAVLDDQSTDVFIADYLLEKLQVNAQEINLRVNTIVGSNTIRTKKISGLYIQDIDNDYTPIRVPYAYTREYIPATHQDIATPNVARQWKHLSEIADKIRHRPDIDIGMLIGRNIPAAFQPINVISGNAEEPWAEQYKFGWTVIGRVCKDKNDDVSSDTTASVNRVTVERETLLECDADEMKPFDFAKDPVVTPPFVSCMPSKDITSPEQVREMMELDYNELHHSRKIRGTEQVESMEDKRFREVLGQGLHKNSNGNWEAPLPFKTDDVTLPNNKKYCLRRLLSLKRKLMNNEKLKADYLTFMQKTLDRGHASRVPVDQLNTASGKVWYLPHFNVYHPRKPDQIRVVFDCSAVFDNESLNKHLLQGPDQMNSLIGVLTRFRKEEVAFMCDIEQMFHSYYVNPDHKDFLRFLWFENNDLTSPIVEYRMDVHLFGAVSSPGVANFCLHETAETHRQEYGNDAADFLRRDFYVDDGLKSLSSVEQTIKLIKDSQAMCAKDKLRLHKFASNRKEVLEALPAEDLAKDLKDLDLRHDSMPVQRSLGTVWCIESDTLGFRIELKDKPLTRRGILSTISSVYDPLGAVSPVILVGKRILQELCRQNADWDDPVPEEILAQWEKWRIELPLLEKLKFPRCLKPPGFGTPINTQIHSFSDASDNGIGQVSYLRMINEKSEVHVSFLMAKSRVAPLKAISIPRLELTAAVISVNVASMLKSELDIEDIQRVYFTDSEIVIGYINNEARRFHVYVGNRVQHIRDRSTPEEWHHVPGKNNPADEASRGLTAKELLESNRWFCGPKFLWQQDTLSFHAQPVYTLDPTDNEVRKDSATTLATKVGECKNYQTFPEVLEPARFSHCSSFSRLKRCIVRIQRMIERIRSNKQQPWRPKEGLPTVQELSQAEEIILKSVQYQHFQAEIKTLHDLEGNESKFQDRQSARERNLKVKRTSNLHKLDPFLDKEGLLRVGGRLRNSASPYGIKHPIVMPRNNHITVLLVRQYHHGKQHHQGYGMTHNAIRQAGFYIINGRSVVSHLIAKCVMCRKLRGRTQDQKMSDLPSERVTPAPPFTYTGMDVFGHFYIKEGRKELKRWGLLFTCLASRAIHLETLNAMTTDSFINALRRFISRRGKVRQLRSDQGTNFVGAKNELTAAHKELDSESIKTFLSSHDCDWIDFNLNIPHASHMGGIWERQIRTTRSVLTSLLQEHGTHLDDEALRTLMIEAEGIVNSRPLTVENLSDPLASEPLTPNHLLTLKTQIVLPPPGSFEKPDIYSRKRWRRVQYLANQFWLRWQKEYCTILQSRQKWNNAKRNMKKGDVVLICENESPRNKWPLAMVTKLYPSKDELVRKVEVVICKNGERRYFDRPVHKLVLLVPKEDD